jgi:hypothetical protein
VLKSKCHPVDRKANRMTSDQARDEAARSAPAAPPPPPPPAGDAGVADLTAGGALGDDDGD